MHLTLRKMAHCRREQLRQEIVNRTQKWKLQGRLNKYRKDWQVTYSRYYIAKKFWSVISLTSLKYSI